MGDVDEYLAGLRHPHTDAARLLREVVLQADPQISEGIKWNAPSFRIANWFATMNIRPSKPVRFVVHTGARARPGHPALAVDDPDALLEWLGTDRALPVFADRADVETKRKALTVLLRQWVSQLGQP